MAGLVWRNGDLNTLETRIRLRINNFEDAAEGLMLETVAQAAVDQAKVLEDATTATGDKRASTGGASSQYGSTSPGRIDSGLMINQINSHVEHVGNVITGRWGWQDPESYFAAQDYGTRTIPAAHSLLESFIRTRETFISRLVQLVKGH